MKRISNGVKILIIGETNIAPYNKSHFAQIKKVAKDAEIVSTEDPAKVARQIGWADIIITSPFHQDLIDLKKVKNLKWVHLSSAGVTDMAKFLLPTKILLTNSSGVHPVPISETVLGYMLMFGRRLNVSLRNQILHKKWIRDPSQNKGFELIGKTVGIVGMGRIGSELAKITKGIGMQVAVLQHDKKVRKVDKVFKVYKDVNKLLAGSNFVVNCLPLTDQTKGYFDMKKFKAMRSTAYFINIGRGKTVVEKDLIEALKSNMIAGAALDVFETEPLPQSSPLWKMDNVILTPHVSGWTPYYTDRVVEIFCKNLKAYLLRSKMPTLVDKKRGY